MNKKFQSLNKTLYHIIKKYNLTESYFDSYFKNKWNEIVNLNTSKIFKPVKIENHVLYLHAKTEYWEKEFENLKGQILTSVNKYTDSYEIIDINFI